jgi:HK97 family phage major capsid protein
MRLSDLLEKKSLLVSEMRSLADKPEFSDTEQTRFDSLKGEVTTLESRISNLQTLQAFERAADASPIDGGRGVHSDLSRYSLARAIRSAGSGKLDGLEGEMHAELSRGREMRGNIMVPTAVLLGGESRSQAVLPATAGGYTVATNLASVADRIDRPALKVESMGATVLRNLTGDLDLPNLAASGTSHWIGEDQNTTRSDAEFEKVSMSPRTISGEYQLSRRLMIQSNESIEALLRRDLGFLLAQGLDAAAIKSSGSPSQPEGLLGAGITKVNTASTLTDTVADLIAALELDDVTGTRAFLTNPYVMSLARKVKDGESRPIPFAQIFHGERVESSTQVPNNIGSGNNKSALLCGIWSELTVGYWSGVDILANPYHSDVASKGGLLLHAFLDCDVAVRHPGAFKYSEIA